MPDILTIQNSIINEIITKSDAKIMEFFEPYLRKYGIVGEITKGKIKWRGIKMRVRYDLNSTTYQLNQRGLDISPPFEIKYIFNYD